MMNMMNAVGASISAAMDPRKKEITNHAKDFIVRSKGTSDMFMIFMKAEKASPGTEYQPYFGTHKSVSKELFGNTGPTALSPTLVGQPLPQQKYNLNTGKFDDYIFISPGQSIVNKHQGWSYDIGSPLPTQLQGKLDPGVWQKFLVDIHESVQLVESDRDARTCMFCCPDGYKVNESNNPYIRLTQVLVQLQQVLRYTCPGAQVYYAAVESAGRMRVSHMEGNKHRHVVVDYEEPNAIIINLSNSGGQPMQQTPTPSVMMSVVIPDGVEGGQVIVVQAPDGQQVSVQVPSGTQPGSSIMVQLPPPPAAVQQPNVIDVEAVIAPQQVQRD